MPRRRCQSARGADRPRIVEAREPCDGLDGGGYDNNWGDGVPLRVQGALAAEAPHGLEPAEPQDGPQMVVLLVAIGLPHAVVTRQEHRRGVRRDFADVTAWLYYLFLFFLDQW